MSSRHTVVAMQTRALVGLAIRLSQEAEGRAKTMDELINDALAVHSAALAARYALSRGKSAKVAYAKAKTVAERYDARVVESGDLKGMVLGLRFTSGRYAPVYCVS